MTKFKLVFEILVIKVGEFNKFLVEEANQKHEKVFGWKFIFSSLLTNRLQVFTVSALLLFRGFLCTNFSKIKALF